MKTRKGAVTRIILWTCVMCVLIGLLVVGVGGISLAGDGRGWKGFENITMFFSNQYDHADEYAAGGTSIMAGNISKVKIHWVSGGVTVRVQEDSAFSFSETTSRALGEDEMLHYRVDGDTLTIEYTRSGGGWLRNSLPSKQLAFAIPAGAELELLAIESASGTVAVDGADQWIDEIDVENVSGSVQLSGLRAGLLDIETASGSVDVGGAVDVIRTEGVSGSQTYRLGQTPQEMRVESVSGSVTVFLPGERGFVAEMEAVSGSMNSTIGQMEGNRRCVYGDASASLRFEMVSGSVRLREDRTLMREQAKAKPTVAVEEKGNGDAGTSGQRKF